MPKKRKLSKGPKTETEVDDNPSYSELSAAAAVVTEPSEEEDPPAYEPVAVAVAPPTNGNDNMAAEDEEEEEEEELEEEEEYESDPASIQNLLEPLQKDQLIDLLRNAAVTHRDVLDAILHTANSDTAHRKIFIHGLGWDITSETLKTFFSTYGEIEECKAVVDKVTGRCKGYGFILFKHRSAARRALKEPQKKIGNRMAACQLASAGPPQPAQPAAAPVSEYTQRKIFVSNVGPDIDPQKLTQFFAGFGEIEEGPLGLDKITAKPKGFCLFVYRTIEGAKKALEEPHKNFEGHVLHCSKAIDGPKKVQSVGFGGSHFLRSESSGGGVHSGVTSHVGGAGGGHLMAPPASGLGLNQVVHPISPAAGLNPALGHALSALIASQGSGLGLTNILGQLGAAVNPAVQSSVVTTGAQSLQNTYGNQTGALGGNVNAYGGTGAQMQGRYGQGGAAHGHQGLSGIPPYRGR